MAFDELGCDRWEKVRLAPPLPHGLSLGRVALVFDFAESFAGEITRFIKSDLMKKRLASQGARAIGSSRAEFLAFMRAEQEKWGKVLKEIAIKPE